MAKIDGVTDIKTDVKNLVCTFKVEDAEGYQSQLQTFAEKNSHLKGYEIQ
ncbi:MAG TPA: hypothetical protein EYG57_15525 [Planctomycetes bacterium]|nr:hypothetical protein [Planctomycetaceae bacterium]HIM30942.1 hypothetical protein [Planctomycetota bacterium]